ncbi:MAG TPA: hypothetical protein VN678_13235, partial [Acidobacteriaceae bacterium]|nr:hypothetical protein [Acidobacteriaceae bacterium]
MLRSILRGRHDAGRRATWCAAPGRPASLPGCPVQPARFPTSPHRFGFHAVGPRLSIRRPQGRRLDVQPFASGDGPVACEQAVVVTPAQ